MFRRCFSISGGDDMTRLLVKLFIRDNGDSKDPAVRGRYGRFAGIVGIISNFLLFLIKLIAGLYSGSISVIADAVNNLTDCGSSVVTLVCFKISGKPADADHPQGHGRMEYVSGLIVSVVILMLGIQLVQGSLGKIIDPEQTRIGAGTVIALFVSILIKLWQFLFYRKISTTIGSLALRAAAADSRNDALSTLAVLLGAIVTLLWGINIDGYIGIAVALFIIAGGVKLISETVNLLLGAAPTKELVDDIQKKVLSYEGIIGIHDLTVHSYGEYGCFASLHCEVPAQQDIMVSHDIVDTIENDFLREQGIRLVIHLDPVVTGDSGADALKEEVTRIIKEISPEIGIHDFRVVRNLSHTNLIFDVDVPYDFILEDKELRRTITEQILKLNDTYNARITIDHKRT
jgi:cation diffusion facilitator family transporter